MASEFVYLASTLAAAVEYPVYGKAVGDNLPPVERRITLAGGHGVINRNLITPQGVITKVTAEDYAALKENSVFKLHVDNGYVREVEANTLPEAAAADLNQKDPGAPLKEEDFPEDIKPTTGAKKK